MDELYQNTVNYALKKGADQVEVFGLEGYSDIIHLEKNAIFTSESKSITGVCVKVYTNKKIGIATSSIIERKTLQNLVDEAIKLSKLSPPDDFFKSLPGPFTKYPNVEGLCDKEVKELPAEILAEMAIEAIDHALEHHEVIINGSFSRTHAIETIRNSLGLEVSQEMSSLTGLIFAKAEKDKDIATSWDFQKTRLKREFSPSIIGKNAAKNAISLLGAKKIKSEELPIILDCRSTLDTLFTILGEGLDAYEVFLGTAFFKDRLGEQLTSDEITVIDNPLHPSGIGSAIFDDEGVPHNPLTLVEGGIAKAYFSNSYCANILGIENTAHGHKKSLGSKPHPDLTQIQIKPGSWTINEMIQETGKGIYLKDTALEPTGGSPTVSILIDQGFLIEKGEITRPLKETMVGTNIFDLLQNISAVSKETINESGSISPAIKIAKASIAGGK